MENNNLKQQLLEAIDNAQIAVFFEKVDENLTANNIELTNKAIYSHLKQEFIAGDIDYKLYQRLTTLTNSIIFKSHTVKYDDILKYIKEISEHINDILITNQRVLLPYIKSEMNQAITYDAMIELFEIQEKRNLFGKWVSYLEKRQESINNTFINGQINELINLLKEIKITLYEVYSESEEYSQIIVFFRFFQKGLMPKLILKEGYGKAKMIIRAYLDNLREKTEKIGEILGNIEFEINKNSY